MGYDELPAAAQTTLLDLDDSKFQPPNKFLSYPEVDQLAALAKSTFRSYIQSNQAIDAFRLCLKSEWYGLSGLAAKWTSKALQLGATDLTFQLCLDLSGRCRRSIFIPFDEVFGTHNVVRLCLDKLIVYQRLKAIKCSGLTSLTLNKVRVPSPSFLNIVSGCPSIEYLSLTDILPCENDYDDNGEDEQKVERIPQGSTITLRKLTTLVLCDVRDLDIQNLFLGDSSSKFPNLKDLTLSLTFSRKRDVKEMYFISIHSLEVLNFSDRNREYYDYHDARKRMVMVEYIVEFDVPSIRKFTFEGKFIPNVNFRSTSRGQWEESHVRLTHDKSATWFCELKIFWFCELKNFLENLTPSKVHLGLHLHCNESFFDYEAGEIEGLGLVELEDLILDTEGLHCLSFKALLDGLFRICRPKMITQYKSPRNKNDMFLCRTLVGQGVKVKRLLSISQFMLCLLDLEEVNAQKFFEDDGTWISQPLDSMLDDDSQRRSRFQLKWKP